jgi:hypothetical protein
MKSLLFLICATISSMSHAQGYADERMPSNFLLGLSATNNSRVGLTGLIAFPAIQSINVGAFISFDIAVIDPKIASGKNEARQTYQYGSAGLIFFSDVFRIGFGFESQTFKPPVYAFGEQPLRIKGIRCPRILAGLSLENHSAMFSCNVWGKEFHYTGYWNSAFTETTSLGVYANSATIGIGLMLRKHNASNFVGTITDVAGSIGYNPRTGQNGIALFLVVD